MSATLAGGWIEMPYTGPDSALVEVSVEPDVWVPAYLDYTTNGQRIAKIRPPSVVPQTVQVWLRVDGVATPAGWLTLP